MAEFIEFLSSNALKELELANKELVTMVANVDNVGKKMKNISTPSGSDSAIKSLTDQYKQQEKVIQSLQNQLQKLTEKQNSNTLSAKQMEAQSIKESNARNSLNKQREQTIKQLEREQARLFASENLYNKVQSKLNSLSNEYKALATRKELGLTLTDKESQRYSLLQTRIQNYDKTLKAVDATMGKHQRNVGNYASGFNPLSNSINQLTREMPAFTYSVQTGFMALSNNIPIFTDAIGNAVKQNKELIAQGQPTTSVLKQVAGALLSWQTLMGVGITLLTVYGKEIGEWIGQLSGASSALDELAENQKKFNDSRFEGKKDAQIEIIELRKYLAVAKDAKLSDEERNIALKQLRSQYPFYFKELSDNAILTGNVVEAEKKLMTALEKRKDVERKTEFNVTNKQKLLDLEKELDILKLQEVQKQKALKTSAQSGLSAQGLATISNELNKIQERKLEIEKDSNKINKQIIENDTAIFQLKKETIGLEYQEEKLNDKKLKTQKDLNFELEDYLASRYALTKATLEQEISMYSALYEDEKQTLGNRLFAFDSMTKKKIELAELSLEEEKRLNKLALENNIATLTQEYNEYIKTEGVTSGQKVRAKQELNNALQSFAKKNALDLELIELKHSETIFDITKGMFENILKIREHYAKLGALKDIQEEELRGYQEYALRLNNITKATTLKRLNEIDKIEKDVIRKAQVNRLQLEIDGIAEKLQKTKSGSEEELKLKTELYEKTKQLTQLEINDLKEKEKAQRDYLKLLDDTYTGFIDKFSSQSGFSGLIDIMSGGLEKFKGDAVSTALVVSEAFQQAFNTIASYSDANFQRMYTNLEQQRDVAILFAGESTTAKEEIERQYEERRRRIQRQQAESQKRLAMFNIVTDTAQAILATYARLGFTPTGIAAAIAMGGVGLLQLGLVASQPIPAFEKGGIHDGGLMLVNDGKGSNYAEKVVTPDGKIIEPKGRNVVMNAPKGTQIFTHDQWQDQMNNILLGNGIQGINQRESTNDIIVNVETKDSYLFNIDEGGINKTIMRGTVQTQILNSRLRIKSKNV